MPSVPLVTLALSALAWSLAVANIWGYGRSLRLGSIIGIGCASSFIALALITGDVFMGVANLAFLSLHVVNYRKARALIKATAES